MQSVVAWFFDPALALHWHSLLSRALGSPHLHRSHYCLLHPCLLLISLMQSHTQSPKHFFSSGHLSPLCSLSSSCLWKTFLLLTYPPFRGAVRGRPLGACFPLPLPSNSSALRSPLGPSFPIRCSGIPFRPVLACSCSSESLKSDRSLLVLESESCLQAKLRSSSENLFTASKGALFSCGKSAGEDRKLPECLPKTLLKVLRRGLSYCGGR